MNQLSNEPILTFFCWFNKSNFWIHTVPHPHSPSLFLQPSQSRWKHQRDLQSPYPDESTQSVDPAPSRPSLLNPVVGQQEEKRILKSVARSSTSWVRDTLTRTSRKHWWLHRTISKWPRISSASLSPFPPPRMFLHSTLLVPLSLSRVCSLTLAWPSLVGLRFGRAQPKSPKAHCLQHYLSAGWRPTPPCGFLTGCYSSKASQHLWDSAPCTPCAFSRVWPSLNCYSRPLCFHGHLRGID